MDSQAAKLTLRSNLPDLQFAAEMQASVGLHRSRRGPLTKSWAKRFDPRAGSLEISGKADVGEAPTDHDQMS